MKALISGSGGQLGQALAASAPEGVELLAADKAALDIADADATLEFLIGAKPDVVINTAAFTAVDLAESEPKLAAAVNTQGAQNVAVAATALEARVIHLSTDFVFDGRASAPYPPEARTNPLGVYGRTKRDGELAVQAATADKGVVLRTGWLYGATGNNFVRTMLRLLADRDELRVVADQRGTPTWAMSLANTVWAFAARPGMAGVFHWSDGGECSWYEFAVAIREEALSMGIVDRAAAIQPVTAAEYQTAATRPAYSVLDCASTIAALQIQRMDWQTNLRNMLTEINV